MLLIPFHPLLAAGNNTCRRFNRIFLSVEIQCSILEEGEEEEEAEKRNSTNPIMRM